MLQITGVHTYDGHIEALRGKRWLDAALSTVTAAVVGVILNLALWFGLHTLFAEIDERYLGPVRLLVPSVASLDPAALALSVGTFLAIFRFHAGVLPTLGGSAVLGALARWLLS